MMTLPPCGGADDHIHNNTLQIQTKETNSEKNYKHKQSTVSAGFLLIY